MEATPISAPGRQEQQRVGLGWEHITHHLTKTELGQQRRAAHSSGSAQQGRTSPPRHAPALMWMPQWVLRAMAEPTVLVTPTHSAPQALAYSSARKVSAVSPDCGREDHQGG